MISIIHSFFNEVNNIDSANNFLLKHKSFIYHHADNTLQFKFTNIQSRKILYSLLLYKFPKELNCPNNLHEISRELILNTLHHTSITIKFINNYLKLFDEWKKQDMENFMLDIASSYINLQETRKSVEDHPEWIEHIDEFSEKLLQYGKKLNEKKFLEILDKLTIQLEDNKKIMIKNMMEQVFWDKFHYQLEENNYDMLFQNFGEIKTILNEIKQEEINDEILDLNYLKQLINNNLFSDSYLVSYINFITDKLLKYGIPAHDKIVKNNREDLVKMIQEKGLSPLSITNTFQSLMNLLTKLIEIIRIYRKVYNK